MCVNQRWTARGHLCGWWGVLPHLPRTIADFWYFGQFYGQIRNLVAFLLITEVVRGLKVRPVFCRSPR